MLTIAAQTTKHCHQQQQPPPRKNNDRPLTLRRVVSDGDEATTLPRSTRLGDRTENDSSSDRRQDETASIGQQQDRGKSSDKGKSPSDDDDDTVFCHLWAMREQELQYAYDKFLPRDCSCPHFDVAWREKICQWSYNVVDHFQLPREIAAVSLDFFDRYLATLGNFCSGQHALLASLTTLYIAMKLHFAETNKTTKTSMTTQTLAGLSRGQFQARHIERMEWSVLKALQWRLHPPTACAFCSYFVQLLPFEKPEQEPLHEDWHERQLRQYKSSKNTTFCLRDELFQIARYMTELALCDSYFCNVDNSLIAFCSVLNALEELESAVNHGSIESATLLQDADATELWTRKLEANCNWLSANDTTVIAARARLFAMYCSTTRTRKTTTTEVEPRPSPASVTPPQAGTSTPHFSKGTTKSCSPTATPETAEITTTCSSSGGSRHDFFGNSNSFFSQDIIASNTATTPEVTPPAPATAPTAETLADMSAAAAAGDSNDRQIVLHKDAPCTAFEDSSWPTSFENLTISSSTQQEVFRQQLLPSPWTANFAPAPAIATPPETCFGETATKLLLLTVEDDEDQLRNHAPASETPPLASSHRPQHKSSLPPVGGGRRISRNKGEADDQAALQPSNQPPKSLSPSCSAMSSTCGSRKVSEGNDKTVITSSSGSILYNNARLLEVAAAASTTSSSTSSSSKNTSKKPPFVAFNKNVIGGVIGGDHGGYSTCNSSLASSIGGSRQPQHHTTIGSGVFDDRSICFSYSPCSYSSSSAASSSRQTSSSSHNTKTIASRSVASSSLHHSWSMSPATNSTGTTTSISSTILRQL